MERMNLKELESSIIPSILAKAKQFDSDTFLNSKYSFNNKRKSWNMPYKETSAKGSSLYYKSGLNKSVNGSMTSTNKRKGPQMNKE